MAEASPTLADARRSRSDSKLAYYVYYTPVDTGLQTMVQVAGMRWMVEECFEAAKGEVGLDQYEVRHWHGCYRYVTLALLTRTFLAAVCTCASEDNPFIKSRCTNQCNTGSITAFLHHRIDGTGDQKLLCRLVWRYLPDVRAVIRWSLWRRRHVPSWVPGGASWFATMTVAIKPDLNKA